MADDDTIVGDGTWVENNKQAWVDGTTGNRPDEKSASKKKHPAKKTTTTVEKKSSGAKQNYGTIFIISLVISVILTLIIMAVSYESSDKKAQFHNTLDNWKRGDFKPSYSGPPSKR